MRSWSEMTGVSAVNAASVQGLSSYQSAPFWSLPLTQVALLFIRFPKVRKCIQEGPIFRTEVEFWVERFIRVVDHGCRRT